MRDNIKSINPIGKNRIKVEVKTAQDANDIVCNPHIKDEKLKAYIPNHLLNRKGLICGVDTRFDDQYLRENISSETRIINIYRLMRKIENDGQASILNSGEQTRLTPSSLNKSAVDTSLASSDISCKFNWAVYNDNLGSDHLPIIISYNCRQTGCIPTQKIGNWNLRSADWQLYSTLMHQYLVSPLHLKLYKKSTNCLYLP